MKTRNWLWVLVGGLGTLALIVGLGYDDLEQSSSTNEAVEAVDVQIFDFDSEDLNRRLREYETAKAAEAAEAQMFAFESEEINRRLREYEAAAEARVFDFESEDINRRLREYEAARAAGVQVFDFTAENINQTLREYETLSEMQGLQDPQNSPVGPDQAPLQPETRLNLPEGYE